MGEGMEGCPRTGYENRITLTWKEDTLLVEPRPTQSPLHRRRRQRGARGLELQAKTTP